MSTIKFLQELKVFRKSFIAKLTDSEEKQEKPKHGFNLLMPAIMRMTSNTIICTTSITK